MQVREAKGPSSREEALQLVRKAMQWEREHASVLLANTKQEPKAAVAWYDFHAEQLLNYLTVWGVADVPRQLRRVENMALYNGTEAPTTKLVQDLWHVRQLIDLAEGIAKAREVSLTDEEATTPLLRRARDRGVEAEDAFLAHFDQQEHDNVLNALRQTERIALFWTHEDLHHEDLPAMVFFREFIDRVAALANAYRTAPPEKVTRRRRRVATPAGLN